MKIGPMMYRALLEIQRHPGASKYAVARAIGPSQRYGYATVQRVLRAGLATATGDHRGYRLWLTPPGAREVTR